jgi:hypothetical protein
MSKATMPSSSAWAESGAESHRHLRNALAPGGVGHAAGAIEHQLDGEVAALQVARAEARDREHAVERAVGIAAK